MYSFIYFIFILLYFFFIHSYFIFFFTFFSSSGRTFKSDKIPLESLQSSCLDYIIKCRASSLFLSHTGHSPSCLYRFMARQNQSYKYFTTQERKRKRKKKPLTHSLIPFLPFFLSPSHLLPIPINSLTFSPYLSPYHLTLPSFPFHHTHLPFFLFLLLPS